MWLRMATHSCAGNASDHIREGAGYGCDDNGQAKMPDDLSRP